MASIQLRVAAMVLAVWATAPAQSWIDPEHVAEARSAFDSANRAKRLRCETHAVQPALTYGLQLQTGYLVEAPMNQFGESGHSLTVLLRVTPAGREPVYLGMSGSVLQVAAAKTYAELPGSFVVGEGAYAVEALAKDDTGRVCYSQWRIQAKLAATERALKTAAPPGAVRELAAPRAGGARTQGGQEIARLTILLHATGSRPGAAKLDDETIGKLVDSLASLLTQLPAKSVRLVLFNLEKQVVLLNQEPFGGRDLEEVTRALRQLQLAVVDYRTLQDRDKADVLSDLLAKELRNPERASAVIFMGPASISRTDAVLAGESRPGGVPWFYLQYQNVVRGGQMGGLVGPTGPPDMMGPGRGGGITGTTAIVRGQPADGIERLVHRLGGVTLPVRTPHDLASAIHRMATAIPTVDVPGGAAPAGPPTGAPAPPPRGGGEAAALADPTGSEDPVDVLAKLRDRVVDNAGSVPNHTCVETVERDLYEPYAGRATKSCDNLLAARKQDNHRLRLDLTDWLRLDVGMADGGEIFSWAGAPKFEEGEIDQLIPEGAFGTGPYAALLLSVFEDRDPRFLFDGQTAIAGRRLLQYSFHVPRDENHYRVKAGKEWVITGYTGTLMVDPRTSDLVRFVVRTEELPAETHMCEVDSTLDYNMAPLGDFEYLLPKSTRQRFIGVDGEERENSVSFASCREFLGESTLQFGRTPASADVSSAPPGTTLPAGLRMTIELTSRFTLGEAAAGDRMAGRLAEPLRDAATHQVLAPAGAKVVGRLTRVELRHSGSGEYTVALRWEGLEMAGGKAPLNLKPYRPMADVKAVARGVLLERGREIELPRPGEEHDAIYHFPGQLTHVEGTLRTEWVTIAGR